MTTGVTVVDYGIGNLKSVCKALEHTGGSVALTSDTNVIAASSRLVLPGVGAFAMCMDELRQRSLIDVIMAFFQTERPFLGICVGMQLMLEASEEFGIHAGLGLIPGTVREIPKPQPNASKYKVPHIGWSPLSRPIDVQWSDTILADCDNGEPFYFVHSFTADPVDSAARLADCDYFGNRLSGVIRDGNRFGCQFHPEKSGEAGLGILRNFLAI
jgi:glutamine amidotransferase